VLNGNLILVSEFNDPFDARIIMSVELLTKELLGKRIDNVIGHLHQSQSDMILSSEQIQLVQSAENPIFTIAKILLGKDPQFAGNEDAINEVANTLKKAVQAEIEKIINPFREAFSNGYLVTCFSEEKDNVLMWSHYAENHSGFCIEYNFKSLGPSNPRVRMLHPVIYKENFFDATEYYKSSLLEQRKFNNL
jgi:hypothetical protein